MKDTAQNTSEKSNKPTHSVYVVKDINGQSHWTKVGAAWEHADKKGFNQIISLLGMDITLTVRENKDFDPNTPKP